jgi:hypothetical protein
MKHFLGTWLLLLIVGGLLIYFQKSQGWLSFLGQIPGDMIIRREGRVLFLPFASSFVVTLLFFLLGYFFRRDKKKE